MPPGALRLIGVQVAGLSDVRVPIQESLFHEKEAGAAQPSGYETRLRLERATASADRLRRKFGPRTVVPASLLGRGPAKPGAEPQST
jgi:hypothetical protein